MTFPWRGLHCLRVCVFAVFDVCIVCFTGVCSVCFVCTGYSYQSGLLTVISTPEYTYFTFVSSTPGTRAEVASLATRYFPHYETSSIGNSLDPRQIQDRQRLTKGNCIHTMSNHATKGYNGIVSGLVYISSPEPFLLPFLHSFLQPKLFFLIHIYICHVGRN